MTVEQSTNIVDYANPLIGTDSTRDFSHGNIYPAISMPFGMTAWTPQTGEKHSGWIYQYHKKHINGFKATHQPSPWIGDYGDFAIIPVLGNKDNIPSSIDDRKASFAHDNEEAHPYYYRVHLDNGIKIEFTPTERSSYWKITYPESHEENKVPYLIIDNWDMGKIEFIDNKITGTAKHSTGKTPDNFACYFVMDTRDGFEFENQNDGTAVLSFPELKNNNTVILKIGTSFISTEQAEINLNREIGKCNFQEIKKKAEKTWNDILSQITIKEADEKQLKTFYSVFYRTKLYPRIFYEFDQENKMQHYSPYSGKVEDGILYTDNGFWDTYRTVYPLFSILSPDLDANIIQGWINAYKEGGWFPKWASPGYRECMIGTPMVNIITDALYKGINSFDVESAYKGCLRDSTDSSGGYTWGRKELDSYIELGYCADDVVIESASRTLEYAYNDFCMAQFAKHLGKEDDYKTFIKRAENYKNIFDKSDKFIKGKNTDGTWEKDFSPIRWGGPAKGGGPYTEGNSWQYTFAIPFDVEGLIKLLGGKKEFIRKLDTLLDPENNKFEVGFYNNVIHEMTEMVACGMGQYEHNNQPVHQILYMYNYAGTPWKAAPHIRNVVDNLYGNGSDGFCGDEDTGEMASWYILSVLGFYPVCPGSSLPGYEIGTPRFGKVTIKLSKNKTLTIIAHNNSTENIYVQSVKVNDNSIQRSWLKHEEIVNGGTIEFVMNKTPNKEFGASETDIPPSMV